MNVKRQVQIAALSCAAASAGLAIAESRRSSCASPCIPANIATSVTLKVVVPEVLVFKTDAPDTTWSVGYTRARNPATGADDPVMIRTASKP